MKKSNLFSVTVFLLLLVHCIDPGKKKPVKADAVTTEQRLKMASKNYLKAWSDQDSNLLQATAIRNTVRNVNGKIVSSNRTGLAETMEFWHTAMPDFKIVEREIIVVGNRTYTNWTFTGTNTGMLGDHPPTGKKSTTEGFSILTFDDQGKLVHETAYFDVMGTMEDWGYSMVAPIME